MPQPTEEPMAMDISSRSATVQDSEQTSWWRGFWRRYSEGRELREAPGATPVVVALFVVKGVAVENKPGDMTTDWPVAL